MTKQEMFDKAVKGLASQGFEKCWDGDTCKYKKGKSRCAVGWLLPEKLKSIDGQNRTRIESIDCDVLGLIDSYKVPTFISDNDDFLDGLQCAHDESDDPANMVLRLKEFAATHDLEIPKELANA